MHLLDVLIAASLFAAVCVSLPAAFAGAARSNLAAADTTWTTVLAAEKVEQLRSELMNEPAALESFDLLDANGRSVEETESEPAYRRFWRLEPLAWAPDQTTVITVVVAPYRRSSSYDVDARVTGATRLVTLRTRRTP